MNEKSKKNFLKNNFYEDSYFIANGIFCIINPFSHIFSDFTGNNILHRANDIIIFMTNTEEKMCKRVAWIIAYCKNAQNKVINIICSDNTVLEKFDDMKIDRLSYEFYTDIPQEYRDIMTMVSFKTSAGVYGRKYGYIINTEEKSFYFGDRYEKIPEQVQTLLDDGIITRLEKIENKVPPKSNFVGLNLR